MNLLLRKHFADSILNFIEWYRRFIFPGQRWQPFFLVIHFNVRFADLNRWAKLAVQVTFDEYLPGKQLPDVLP